MRHPTDGTLRRLLDEPDGVADADRGHIAGCPQCLTGLAAARDDAARVEAALRTDTRPDVDAAWQRLSRAAAPAAAAPAPRAAARGSRWRTALRSPVIAGVAVVALLTGAGAAAAANWFPIFHTDRVAPIRVTQADLVNLPDLSAYGTVRIVSRPEVREAANVTSARQITGLPAPAVADLPRGVTGEPAYQVGDEMVAEFTFSAERAARTAAAAGQTLPPPPAGLDGSRFRLTAGPGIAAVWSDARGFPALLVGRAVAPTGYSEGIPFRTAVDYLLTMPGLPDTVAAQLRGFTGSATTLPLIVKADQETTTTTDVNGVPAVTLASRDRAMAVVIWVADGHVNAVGGSLSTDEVLTVARNLRWDR